MSHQIPTGDAKIVGTSEYYERHAREYFERTVAADMAHVYAQFLPRLHRGARVLDAGAGSGRDLREFVRCGFEASGIDASPALAELATQYSGAPCQVLRLEDLQFVEQFDGIWACASLLHVKKAAMLDVLCRLRRALVASGLLFISLQEGEGEMILPDGRFLALYTEQELRSLLTDAGLELLEMWRTDDVLRDQEGPSWVNVLAARSKCNSPDSPNRRDRAVE